MDEDKEKKDQASVKPGNERPAADNKEKDSQDKGSESDTQHPEGDGDEKQTVSHESYLKVLDEAKKAKAKLKKLEAEKEETDKKKLEEQGKFKELLEKEQAKGKARDLVLKKKELRVIAVEAGMHSADDIIPYLDKFEFDDDFNVTNRDEIIDKLKKEKPYLFKPEGDKQVPATDTGKTSILSGKGNAKKVADMTIDEYREFRKNLR